MKTYTHDYTLASEALSNLSMVTNYMTNGDYCRAEELLSIAWGQLDEYLANDNLVEDEEGAGWIKADKIEDLVTNVPEVCVINLTRGDDLAQVISCGSVTRSYEALHTKKHRSILKAIAHLEAKGYEINNDVAW